MTHRPAFSLFLGTTAALALSACEAGGGDEISPAPVPSDHGEVEASGEMLVVSETGWLTIGSDGAIQTTFFDPDGRYRDLRNGDLIGQGGWEQRADGSLCFAPDNGDNVCWRTGSPDVNGTVIATSEDDKTIELKRVTYVAPMAQNDPEAPAEAEEQDNNS